METRLWYKNANICFCCFCHNQCWFCCFSILSLKEKKAYEEHFRSSQQSFLILQSYDTSLKKLTQSFLLFSLMRGIKEMCQPAEHQSAVLPLNQAKKPVSVTGTSKSRSHLAEQASCFHNIFTGLHAGAMHYGNFHPLDRGMWDLEVGSAVCWAFLHLCLILTGQ